MKKIILSLLVVGSFFNSYAQDIEGAKDHPLISRYPGASIAYFYQKEYNELQFAQGKKEARADQLLDVKGKHTSILYKGPEGRSTIEIFRNYEEALNSAGAEILFSCNGDRGNDGCDNYNKYYDLRFFSSIYPARRNQTDQYIYLEGGSTDQAYLTAKIDRGNTITYVEIGIVGTWLGHPSSIQVEIVEVSKMDRNLVTVESIKEQLDKYGKIQIYTIFFTTNSAEIEEGSATTLQTIADYLAQYPEEQLYVVGHTDDTGAFEYNIELSDQRASAVVESIKALNVSAARQLTAKGVGPLSPEGSNETEEGKAMNRRVELVRRLK